MTDYITYELAGFSDLEMFNIEMDLEGKGYERLIVVQGEDFAVFRKKLNCDMATAHISDKKRDQWLSRHE